MYKRRSSPPTPRSSCNNIPFTALVTVDYGRIAFLVFHDDLKLRAGTENLVGDDPVRITSRTGLLCSTPVR